MSYEFRLPELGEKIVSGDVVKVLVQVGDHVKLDQIVLELETDKAVLEVPSPAAGIVQAVHVSIGQEVPVGGLILTLDTTAPATAPAAAPAKQAPAAAPTPAPAADPGESTLTEYPPMPAADKAPATPAAPTPSAAANVTASPSVRRLAREIGVDLAAVAAQNPGSRLTENDVKAFARDQNNTGSAAAPTSPSRKAAESAAPLDDADFAKWGDIRRETMSRVRKVTAQNMTAAWNTIPMVTHFDEADITDINEQRRKLAAEVEATGGSLTVTAITIKIVGLALREFPKFRASLDIAQQEIVYKDYVHIGVAVDTDRGLLVPVLRDVDKKDLGEIAVELGQVSAAARTGKLSLEDMQGAVFTVSNLGGIGGTNFNPIINPPQSAIMGVSRGQTRPVFMQGTFVPRLIMPFSVTYDHRLIDGADAARFCRWIATTIESPLRLLLRHG